MDAGDRLRQPQPPRRSRASSLRRGLATRPIAAASTQRKCGRTRNRPADFTYDFRLAASDERNGYELVGQPENFPIRNRRPLYRKLLSHVSSRVCVLDRSWVVNPRKTIVSGFLFAPPKAPENIPRRHRRDVDSPS